MKSRVFRYIEKVNETIVLLNLFLMIAEYPREPAAIVLFCCCVAVVGVFKAAIVWQVYSRQNLLNEEEAEDGNLVGTGNSSLAVQVNSAVVFLASVWLLAMWIVASCKNLVIFCLCFIVPINSDVINWVQIGMIGVFILMKLLRNVAQKRLEKGEAEISMDKNQQLSEIPTNAGSFRAMHEGTATTTAV
uniref:Uncharacterized protein n=1 Tax=Branchiostoma floridae TaxID=7739 RepID=C3Z620_BRAFL|eukprot:XP_002596271.1 hypothetical protein BRAFLDRAFT_65973 [Branchiostoma floridae]